MAIGDRTPQIITVANGATESDVINQGANNVITTIYFPAGMTNTEAYYKINMEEDGDFGYVYDSVNGVVPSISIPPDGGYCGFPYISYNAYSVKLAFPDQEAAERTISVYLREVT